MKCLVVDDSSAMLNSIKNILVSENHEVLTAENGLDALDKYSKFKPDIVTLDIMMPLMDGYETLKRLLAIDKNATVIMLTAAAQTEMVHKCMTKGAKGFIEKPFSEKTLLSLIKSLTVPRNNPKVTLLFSMIAEKLKDTIARISKQEVSVSLESLQYNNVISESSSFKNDKIISISKPASKVIIELAQNALGYISEINGQQCGIVITSIKKAELDQLLSICAPNYGVDSASLVLEFFNIINMKVISEIANDTHLVLNSTSARLFDQEKDTIDTLRDLVIAKFVIEFKNSMKLETIVLFDMDKLFTN